jgi:uncharacterized caspase-like protein
VRRAAAALLLLLALPAPAAERRFALVAGQPDGGPGTQRLRYAERDARRIHAILTRIGGVREEDARLLLSPDAGQVMRALGELEQRSREASARGDQTLLLVYYSGHSKDGELRLGSSRLPLADLRGELQAAAADVRIALLDSCQAGAITRSKGARRAPAFDVSRAGGEGPRGLVLIASSSASEDSQESDYIGGSFFTHYLASGLLGDADSSGDGRVTLAEAYAYAYGRTVASTAESAAGVQHPAYHYDLGGSGDVVLTQLGPSAALVLGAPLEGVYVVLDSGRRAVAEVAKAAGAERRLALPPGSYTVKKRLAAGDALLVGEVSLSSGAVALDESRMQRLPLSRDPQKGFTGARWSVLGGLGYQSFFSAAARDGYFPPALLGGFEVSSRDDLGHGLAWGMDAALGGGSSSLSLGGGAPPIAVRFTEVSGGASLWLDFPAGPLVLSGGGRVAFIWLGRSFPGRTDLRDQYFFTVTPGLVAAATWRFSPSLAAVARGRLNYLFYNVDKNQSLGYAELLLGVEYAFP